MNIFNRIAGIKILFSNKKIVLVNLTKKNQQSTLKNYKLDTPLFKKILSDELVFLTNVFKKNNYELRIAGGAVRDLIMNIFPHDIDLATNALPDEMIKMLNAENIRIINLNGLKHGTVPVRINDKQNFEITTLRIDVKTYGRHAEVEFTNDWHKDAIRRDLTVNSLFLDLDGTIFDYVNGVDDINNKIIKFVGIPDKRVKEDYLRILRYFRFYSRVKSDCKEHHKESLEAIRNNAEGLKIISGQRIGYELRKILSQKFCDSFMEIFYEFSLAPHMGLPVNGNLEKFKNIYQKSFKNKPLPHTLLSALMNSEEDINKLDERIKLSNDEKSTMLAIKKYENVLDSFNTVEEIIEFFTKQFLIPKSSKEKSLRKEQIVELMKYLDRMDLADQILALELPNFPLNFKNINQHKIFDSNKQKLVTMEDYSKEYKIRLNHLISELKHKWIDSNFSLTQQDLLNLIDEKLLKEKSLYSNSKKQNKKQF
ncbi:unnamed protein product [Brachionus calyciflorus]|uniref:Uncharacterized protein n=1 Tax=Brachionus calyciflorus TaxID=104777 RepID=A0A813URR2_9BILA|nr:unnamed protein product [Brachionus calyciflorus]